MRGGFRLKKRGLSLLPRWNGRSNAIVRIRTTNEGVCIALWCRRTTTERESAAAAKRQ